ncbi:zinc finger CCCH domain-containing protein 23-like [Cornus florida]|uniref:zinc finger CCCH domain-containing protein 23-like n=1 Tax=Cornus florida TaxID=4283 RepID=UPI0028A05091|nr:zinc finger CCCH domain-containing protein 23-like [Cornus florida]
MMMMGDTGLPNPIIQVPPWDLLDDPTAMMGSPFSINALSVNLNGNATSPNGDNNYDALTASLQRYLPSNVNNLVSESDALQGDDYDIPVNAFSCDQFRMYEFKVRRCARGRSHDWTECPYAHPGEKARRRDPRKYNYSGTVCSEFRKGQCKKGDSCELAHGVFECWLHPSRYRTQPCKDGTHCRRRVCFFAHTPDQLRVLPQTSPRMSDSFDGSPSRLGLDSYGSFGSSPTSTLYSPPVSPPSDSPPMSPHGSLSVNSVSELAASMRNLQIGKARMSMSPPSWGVQMGSGFCSPRSQSNLRPGFLSLPTTPTRVPTRSGLKVFELWEKNCEEEPVMERVESGKELRAKIYAKLSKENSLDRVESASPGPDVGWVSELVM